MNKDAIKDWLKGQIEECQDINVLKQLKTFIEDSQTELTNVSEPDGALSYKPVDKDIPLTEDQIEFIKSALEKSQEDVRKGRLISHEDVKTYYWVKALLDEE